MGGVSSGGVSSGGVSSGGVSSGGASSGGVSSGGVSSGGVSSGGVSSGGLAGMGTGGSSQSAVAECEQYCETLDYLLPGALCEDWSPLDSSPSFCDVFFTTSCADYCSRVYDTVTPACAAVLPAAIRCVAPTYVTGLIPPLNPCLWAECRHELYSMTSACYGLQEQLAGARATWQMSGVVDYRLNYDWDDDVRAEVIVRAGSEPAVTPADAIAWTVPKLFDEVERTLQEPGGAPRVTYHADLGYVVRLAREHGCTRSGRVSGVEVVPLR